MIHTASGRARYRRILRFAAWNLGVTWWYEIFLPRIGMSKVAERTRNARMQRFARRFRLLAIDLGGLMIKLGQYMSSRLDVLPPEITRELEGLQDEVPAVPFEHIKALAERELGVSLEQVFASIETEPIAAASLGQAYRATLSPANAADVGFDKVVVKVQRPGIDEIVDVDLAALRRVGVWLSKVRLVSDRADMPVLIEEFAATCLEEIDYLNEASNSERFRDNFADNPKVKVPVVVWERSTRQVLTLEDVSAIKITDTGALKAAGIEPLEVANVFASLMFDQLFKHAFFHADPHPGNLFVTPAPDGSWAITFIDFGMMGQIPTTLRDNLRKVIISAAARDGRGLVDAMAAAGVILPSADAFELERVMSGVFDRFGGMGFAELREVDPREFRDFAMEFSDVILSLPFQLPENFLLVIRSVSLTSGVCSSLEPSYNLWDSVEPYAASLLQDQSGGFMGDIGKQAMDIAALAWRLPRRADTVLARIEEGKLPLSVPRLEASSQRLERSSRRLTWAVVFAGLLLAGATLRESDPTAGLVLMIASGWPLSVVVFSSLRR